ncbi:hypothetical protein AWN88_00470 [Agrobacterium tumefaciens]|nr:hypothetical protein AWN88_00470 [Agrobacterium tumefaciens]
MAHDDPFTLDIFGSTALSSGLGLGVTAFSGDFDPDGDPDPDPDPTTPAPAKAVAGVAQSSKPRTETRRRDAVNFHLAGSRGLAKAWKKRARDSIAAIRGRNKSSPKSYAKVERNRNDAVDPMCNIRSLWIATDMRQF